MASVSDIKALLDAQTETIQQSIRTQIDEVKEEVKDVKAVQEDHGNRISGLEADVKAMKSSKTTSGAFSPSSIILKNFCEFKDKKTRGVTRAEAETLTDQLKAVTPDSLRSMIIGLDPLKGTRVYDFSIGIKDPKYCREIAAIWKEQNLTYNSRQIWIHAERSPQDKKRYGAAGSFRAFCEGKLGGQGKVECSWHPDFVLTIEKESEAPVVVASVNVAGDLNLDELMIKKVLGLSAQEVLEELTAFKKQRRQ